MTVLDCSLDSTCGCTTSCSVTLLTAVHLFDATDCSSGWTAHHVLSEQLIAEHCEAFLESQLKPISNSHSIASPIMEILVCNNPLQINQFKESEQHLIARV